MSVAGSELDLERRGDGTDDVGVEIVGHVVTHHDTIDRLRSRASTGQDADSAGKPQLDIFRREIGYTRSERPCVRLVAETVACAPIPGQADGSAPLIVEFVANTTRNRPAVTIKQVKRGGKVTWIVLFGVTLMI